MEVVYTDSEMPDEFSKSIFLAGCTPRNADEVESWRPEAIELLEKLGFDGVVFVPEDSSGNYQNDYDSQIAWEEKYLNASDCIVFWLPRDLSTDSEGNIKMGGLTTNIEWGAWASSGKVVFGAPEDADKVTYLKHYASEYNVPVSDTLEETLANALAKIPKGALRKDGERYVPLMIWNTASFQSWYQTLVAAGNRLDCARLLYNFRPRYTDFVFLWVLKVDIYIAAEDRNKTNEFVLARPDISSVIMFHHPEDGVDDSDCEIVLVKEFRSPASTEDGFILELPGGSSFKPGDDAATVAAEEVSEETGFDLDPSRLHFAQARQLAGTLSSHKSHLYFVPLKKEEIDYFKGLGDKTFGNEKDTEKTYVEVMTVRDLVYSNRADWSTLGMVLSVFNK